MNAASIIADPAALTSALGRDPFDAANDAETLAATLRAWADDATQQGLRETLAAACQPTPYA